MAKKSWFGWPSEVRRADMVRNKDTKEHSSLRFMPPIRRDVQSSQLLQEIPHRPVEMNVPESLFYLAVQHN